MGEIKKQGIFNSVSTYLGIGVGAINTIILFPRAFVGEDEKWGLIQFMLAIGVVVAGFSNFGLSKSLPRFIQSHKNYKEQLISFASWVSLAGAVIFIAIALLFKTQIIAWLNADQLFNDYYFIFIPLVILLILNELYTGIFQGYLRTRLPLFLNEVGVRLGMSAVLVSHAIFHFSYTTFMILFLSVYGIRSAILLIEYLRKYRVSLFIPLDGQVIKEFLKYGFVTIFSASTAVFLTKIDQIFVGSYDLKELAYYGLAFYLGSMIMAPARSLSVISIPVMAGAWARENYESIKTIYNKSALNSLLIGGALFWMMWLSLDSLYFFLPEKYAGGKTVFFIVGLSRVFGSSMGLNGSVLNTSPGYRINVPFSIIVVIVAIAANYYLIPIYGINGAASAVFITVFVDNLLRFLFLWIAYNIQPFKWNNLTALVVVSIPGLLLYFLNINVSPILNLIIIPAVYAVMFLPVILKLDISPDLTHLIHSGLSKVRFRRNG